MLILLWGIPTEAPLQMTMDALSRLGVATLLVDQQDEANTDVVLSVDGRVDGWIQTADQRVALPDVTAAYPRPYDVSSLPEAQETSEGIERCDARQHVMQVEQTLRCWIEVTPALVVNRFSAMASNTSKPYQLQCIRRAGFAVPDTLVTTDPGAALAFWELHGAVIYKSTSAARSIVSRLEKEHLSRLANVAHCPTQFQEYIDGVDFRVHVVGSEVYACEVSTQASDYRYPGDHDVSVRACDLPQEVEDRCRAVAQSLELPFAGVDLRRNSEGEWYCFEVNPSPGYSYYQRAADLPISDAVARLLASSGERHG